ncbi:MAG: AAA family ATPase [Myxococcota bacterium]|nr:AAA family ATPase [Myxococcota bacterium]
MAPSDALLPHPLLLDETRHELRRGEERIPLPPKSLELLRVLLERAGAVVTRDELLEAVWRGVHVTPDALRYSMRQLRLALDDSVSEPVFIETLPRVGWRFVGQAAPVGSVGERGWQFTPRGSAGLDAPSLAPTPAGRAAEMRALQSALARTDAGERVLLFVSGEAGIGKTMLVESFLSGLELRGEAVVGRGQCVEDLGAGEAYLPVFEVLERVCQRPELPEATDVLRRLAPTWLAQLPALSEPSEREALRAQAQGATQGRMIRELNLALEALSADRTLVLWIDDLHWSDASTLEFLARCIRRREPARLLMIATHRPMAGRPSEEAFDLLHRDLIARDQSQSLELPYLESAEIVEYLEGALGTEEEAGETGRLADFLLEHTEGHPLFMVSLVRELLDRGAVERTGSGFRLRAALDASLVPRTLEQLLARGLDGIDDAQRETLQALSVIGMRASAADLAAALERNEPEVEASCDRLADRGQYLTELDPSARPDGHLSPQFEFVHALHRKLFDATVSDSRRLRWHQRVGESKRAAWGERAPEIAGELAQHFAVARDARQASEFFGLSGEAAAQLSSNLEAIDQFERALDWVERLPDGPERGLRELGARISTLAPLAAVHGYAAPALARNLSRIEELAPLAGDSPAFEPVLLGLWSLYLVRGDLPAAVEVGERLVRSLGDESSALSRLQAHRTLGFCRLFEGRVEEADAHMETAVEGFDLASHQRLDYSVGDDPVVLVHSYESWIAWFAGDPDRSARATERALAVAERLDHPPSLAIGLAFASIASQLRGDVAATRSITDSLHELAEADGMAMWSALSDIFGGWAMSRSPGEETAGVERMRAGLAAWEATGSELGRPYFLSMVGESLARAGDLDGAEALLPTLERSVSETGQVLFASEPLRLRALVSQGRGDLGLAEDSFRDAVDRARASRTPGLELRAALGLRRVLLSREAPDQTSAAVSEALSRCRLSPKDADQLEATSAVGS